MTSERYERLRGEAEEAAEAVLEPLGISGPAELRTSLHDIAAYRGAYVRTRTMDKLSGRLVRKRDKSIITINSDDSAPRQRFSLGHELGHHELHKRLNQVFACTPDDMEDYRASDEERQANLFAASLLMPRQMFLRVLGEQEPSIANTRRLAREFGTSLTATAIRLVQVTDERAALVCSSPGGILWAITNKQFDFAIDRRPLGLSKYSYAYDVLHGKSAQETPSEIEGDTWLHFDLNSNLALYESAVQLGSHGTAISVLWIRER